MLIVAGIERNGWVSLKWQQIEKLQWGKHLFAFQHKRACHVFLTALVGVSGAPCVWVGPPNAEQQRGGSMTLGQADLYNMYQHVWTSEISENFNKSVDSSKNYLDVKEKVLSTLNKVRSQYTPLLFSDNMDLSILNAIRTDEFAGACSSLLVGLCWASCRSSHATSVFWQCPYSSLSTGKDCKLQLSCSQLQPSLAGCLPSSRWILLLLLPTSEVKLCLKSSLSCWSAEDDPGKEKHQAWSKMIPCISKFTETSIFFAPWYLLETMCRISLLRRKRAVPVSVPGPQHSWQCGQPEHRAGTWCCGRQSDCSWRSPAPPSAPAATLLTQDYTGVSTDLAASWATCFDPAWICFGLFCDSNIYFQLKRGGDEGGGRHMVVRAWSWGFSSPSEKQILSNTWIHYCHNSHQVLTLHAQQYLHTNPNCPYTHKAPVHYPWSNQALDPYFSK